MRILNVTLGGVIELLLYPFRSMPPMVGLAVVSVLTGIGMLLVFKATSNQDGLTGVKRRISASVFEIRLFNDDPRAIFRAEADIFRHTMRYLGLTLVPVLWMIVPLLLVLVQLQFHYGYEGIEPGGTALVKVRLHNPSADAAPGLTLGAGAGLRVDSPMLWIPSEREATWRIAVDAPGEHQLLIHVGDEIFEKSLDASDASGAIVRRAPVRPSGLWGQAVYPVEAPLPPDGPVESIAITYPERLVSFFGWDVHWLVVFFILSIIVAFALQRPFKVTL